MKTLYTLVLTSLVPFTLWAEEAPAPTLSDTATPEAAAPLAEPPLTEPPETEPPEKAPFGPVSASDVVLEELKFLKRPVVVFADSPMDPTFVRQMQLLERDLAALDERDVVLIIDTDPAAKSAIRQQLRPRGFSLVLMEKDMKPVIRKPLPWDVREIVAAIDKFPLRRQEALERYPSQR